MNNSHAYKYDANGNLVYVNTSRTKKDGMADEKTTERKLKWDEENRLLASDDNGFVTNYWYDADGERTVKISGESDQVYVNSEFAGGRTNIQTIWVAVVTSPTLMARWCSISSMCLSVRYLLRNATTEGGKQSAATILEHEMDHAVDDAQNHKNHVDRANIIIL